MQTEIGTGLATLGIFLYEKLVRRASGTEAVARSILFGTVNRLTDVAMKEKVLSKYEATYVSKENVSAVGSAAVAAVVDAATFSGKHALAHGVVGAVANLAGNMMK